MGYFSKIFQMGVILLFMLSYPSESQVKFQKLYARTDSTSSSGIMQAIQTKDGNYLMVGGISTGCHNCAGDALIIKTNANGDTLWSRKMGGIRDDYFYTAAETYDGNYLFIGQTESFGRQATSSVYGAYLYFVKTNNNGDTLWTRIYGGTNTDSGHPNNFLTIKQTADSGFIFIAQVKPILNKYAALIIKTNAKGDTLWTKSYQTSNGIELTSVQQTLDGGYIFSGDTSWSNGFNSSTSEGLLVKTDAVGNIQWQRTYGGNRIDQLGGIEIVSTGGYVACGYNVPQI